MDTGEQGTALGTKALFALVLVGMIVGGVAALVVYRENSREGAALDADGVKADADVVSVREEDGYTELMVSYDPPGDEFLEFAEVQDCDGGRYEQGIETVRVVYLPDDPDVIRLESCQSSFDTNVFPGIVGLMLLGFAAFMLVRLRRFWTS